MKILFLGVLNPKNKKGWSGTIHYLFKTLNKHYDVEWVSIKYYGFIKYFFLNLARFKRIITGKRFIYTHGLIFSKIICHLFSSGIKDKIYDLIFAPDISFAIPYLKTTKPIIVLDDSYFPLLVNYNKYFFNLNKKQIRDGKSISDNSLLKAAHVIYPSEWVAKAQKVIGAEKITVAKFGANLDRIPSRDELIYIYDNAITLLFVGVGWDLKGGSIAVEALKYFNKSSFNVKLIIVGSNPQIVQEDVYIIPYINKDDEKDFEKLYQLYSQASFFILPSRSECAGIVFCEASAFGIPIITTDTGGIPDYVENDVNGYRLPLEATGKDFAEKILSIYSDKEKYLKLRKSARKKFEEELNWDVWLQKFDKIVEKIS